MQKILDNVEGTKKIYLVWTEYLVTSKLQSRLWCTALKIFVILFRQHLSSLIFHFWVSLWTGLWLSGELGRGKSPSLPFPCYFFSPKRIFSPKRTESLFTGYFWVKRGANLKIRQGNRALIKRVANLIVYGTPDCTSANELKISGTFRLPDPSPPVKFPYSPIHNLLWCRHVSILFISSICVKLLHR